MNAICLVIDRWHLGHIGAYGNTWIETPSLDRLACESFLFDQAMTVGLEMEDFYAAAWQGRHPLLTGDQRPETTDFVQRLADGPVHSTLLTDTPELAGHRLVASFDEIVEFEPPERIEPADDVGQTHLARCFAQLIDYLGSTEKRPFMTWVHLSSMGTCWDAPHAFRAGYAEPGDPEPARGAKVPHFVLPKDYDPDLLLAIMQAYAGQATLLDICLGALVEAIDECAGETMLAVCAARGFPLGEHGRVGVVDETLHAESVHIPMMVRFPGGLGAARRSQALVTPADLRATLLDLWSLDELPGITCGKSLMPIVRGEAEAIRDRLLLSAPDGQSAVRTPAWYMRLADEPQLYVKPDDRWEVNDVADRCAEVVERLDETAEQYRQWLIAGQGEPLEPLVEILRDGVE